jgi:peptide deformylase
MRVMACELLTYGNEALRRKAVPVEKVNDSLRALAREMLAVMRGHNGVGLAAEQIGRTEAVIVIDIPKPEPGDPPRPLGNPGVPMPLVMVNPQIIGMAGEQRGPEGCLSFPEIFVDIARAAEVTATYTDLQNHQRTLQATGLLARAIQHEIDHLNGVLLVDRMSPVQKMTVAARLRRLKRETRAALKAAT